MARNSGWWSSIKNFLTYFQHKPHRQAPTAPKPVGPRQTVVRPVNLPQVPIQRAPDGDIEAQIAMAAGRNCLLWMVYNGTPRYVEPYSYRFKTTGKKLYAFCHKDQHIEMFTPEKIAQAQATDIPFAPRWPVEISQS